MLVEDHQRRQFWADYQPGLRATDAPVGTPEFFAAVERQRYRLEPEIARMARFEEWRDQDVLEAGCGIATDGINFARAGARYTGVDFSDTAVSLARHRFALENAQGRIIQASITALPAGDASQDLVYSNGVIHHIPETERVVGEFHRVLRPGGQAVVMLYHRGSLNYHVNIMLIRRLLAIGVLTPGFAGVVGRVTGEDAAVVTGYRRLFEQHGLRLLTDRQLFLNNSTDGPGNPLSKVYSRADAHHLFRAFTSVSTLTRFLNLRLYPGGERLGRTAVAHRLEQRYGWHLWISATK